MVAMGNRMEMLDITFTSANFKRLDSEEDDPMTITTKMANFFVRKTLIDKWSLANILFCKTFKQMDILEFMLQLHDDPLFGFFREKVLIRGFIELMTRFDSKRTRYKDIIIKYVVLHASTSYNILLGQPSINAIGAIVSTPLLAIKFLFEDKTIITVHANQKEAQECYMANLKLTPI